MKEFDKIYLAKYGNILTVRQLAEDLKTTQKEVKEVLEKLKMDGMYDIYKNISDYEWERLEKMQDEVIKTRYFKYSECMQKKVKKEIFKAFNVNIYETIMQFQKYEYGKEDFDRN